ncbi:magnesium chelatase family protein [Fibrobacter sp. UWOV1]|uniref:YifB family Mg chelatase-like AAA ATPase n=1 Tax=Fibrobacter sp. UWOV1 TaxID=1896215 RepID=UPI000910A93D|nr:YifB family Mg chelatase-like AAA ATPase [Fibrobacter sp. UWOV1]SHK53178.1 magnesium chelatase family protein [Fibrobacter sp. UWOV1]
MFRRIRSYCLLGIKAVPVNVEVDSSQGLPGFTLVGLPDNAVRESRERVVSAIRSAGKVVTGFRTTVNLSPADLRKEGSALDLPLAFGLLTAAEEIEAPDLEHLVFVGELSLDGLLKPVRGVLSIAMSLSEKSKDILVIPKGNEQEASLVEGIRYVCADTLMECIEKIEAGAENYAQRAFGLKEQMNLTHADRDIPDFKNVVGMEGVKRALEVAAAGAHNFLMVGSPGAGKTLCAKCLPGVLPEMTELEILETTRIHSCARSAGDSEEFKPVMIRPFRTPHHSASMVSLVGGGTRLKPGEASLAHNGVLFLDELPEFNRSVLEALREPMEEGEISISRASGTVTWPARFMMGAAMNPCPCGYAMDPKRACTCLPEARKRYQEKISGPLLDRIDIQVSVPPVEASQFGRKSTAESSAEIRKRICSAREIQRKRFEGTPFKTNAEMTSDFAKKSCKLSAETEQFAINAADRMGLSARGFYRLLKVGRTIADLRKSDSVEIVDLSEALRYRAFRS